MKFKRYYAIRGKNGYFNGHNVVTIDQMKTVFRYNKGAELFAALEYYYPNGEVAGLPLSFDVDFDGELDRSLSTARRIAGKLDDLGLPYDSWFSGSKGLHIVVPHLIMGDRAHIICKAIKRTLFDWEGVDEHIYRTKSLFRLQGSVNKKTGLYKVPVDLSSSLDEMLELAKEPCEVIYEHRLVDGISLNPLIAMSSAKLFEMNAIHKREVGDDEFEYDTVPCIAKMWRDLDPPRDDWHQMIYTLAKDGFNAGLEPDDLIARFDNHEFWGSICGYGYSRRSYTKIVRSLYQSGKWGVGCKSGGLSSDIMLKNCSVLCHFNKEIDAMGVFNNGKGKA